jgi:hypothetical protein
MIWTLGILLVAVVLVGVVLYARRDSLAERRELRRELRRLRAEAGQPQSGFVSPVNEQNSGGHGFAGFNDGGGAAF